MSLRVLACVHCHVKVTVYIHMRLCHVPLAGTSKLETALQAAEAALDTDTRKFAVDVEQRVTRLKKEVLSLREVYNKRHTLYSTVLHAFAPVISCRCMLAVFDVFGRS